MADYATQKTNHDPINSLLEARQHSPRRRVSAKTFVESRAPDGVEESVGDVAALAVVGKFKQNRIVRS